MQLGAANSAGLQPDQGPPLSIPASFFSLAPLSLVAAGLVLLLGPELTSRWTPTLMAVTHIGTLGLLGSVMLGALYQMVPVLAGQPVPLVRLGHGVFVAWVVGAVALIGALMRPSSTAFTVAAVALGCALIAFLLPMAVALGRATSRAAGAHRVEVHGMRAAVLALGVTGLYGVYMASGWAQLALPANRMALIGGHVTIGLLGWIGVLLTSVSTKIIPMFYLTAEFPRRPALVGLGVLVASVFGAALAPLLGAEPRTVAWLALPAAALVWLVHPAIVLRMLADRRRKRVDMSVRFWQAGLCVGPLIVTTAIASLVSDDARWPLLFGWFAVFGWGGLIVHGMLTRIGPFLVWFHRYAPIVGHTKVPPMRQLFPASRSRPALLLHGLGVAIGALGLGLNQPILVRLAGGALVGSGVVLAYAMARMATRSSPRKE